MIRSIIFCLVLIVPSFADAAYPYDSIAEILFDRGDEFNEYNGGSASLIAVSDTEALLLTCSHVAEEVGGEIRVHWAATGEMSVGRVVATGGRQDIALCICPRPKGLYPIPLTLAGLYSSGRITNAGFPGLTGTLEWQTGELTAVRDSTIVYDCRPIPGMSGGVTFDQYGNQIGVIIQYGARGGVSSSGPDMFLFVRGYLQEHKAVWLAGFLFNDSLEGHDSDFQMQDYSDYDEFSDYVWDEITGPFTPPAGSSLFEWDLVEEDEPVVQKKRKCKPRHEWSFPILHRLRN